DTARPSLTAGATVTVTGPPPAKIDLTGIPSAVASGAAVNATVTARDASGVVVTDYAGTIHFTSSDPNATLPADYTFKTADAGTKTFAAGVTLRSAGSRTVTVTDTALASLTATATATVTSVSGLEISGVPAAVTAGTPLGPTVTAKDASGAVVTGYTGTIHFTSSDTAASLPGDYTFGPADAGTKTFPEQLTLQTAGSQTVTATDTAAPSLTGSQTVTVLPRVGFS